MFSFALWLGSCLFLVSSQSWLAIIFAFVLYGLHKGAIDTVQTAFVAELSPLEYRASSLGLFKMVTGICALPGSLIAGLLWDKISPAAPFYFSLVLTVISMAALLFVKEKEFSKLEEIAADD
jgi:MFS family permease